MYLIDTDILAFLLRGHDEVTSNFRAHAADAKAFSVITYGELLRGAMKSSRLVENMANTNNLRHFQRVPGLKVENWVTVPPSNAPK